MVLQFVMVKNEIAIRISPKHQKIKVPVEYIYFISYPLISLIITGIMM